MNKKQTGDHGKSGPVRWPNHERHSTEGQMRSMPVKAVHSLTHCCAWPAEGRSVLDIERSWPAIQAAPTDRPTSSSTCCSQFLRGRPGGRFQSAAGGVPVWASIDSWSACEAGVFSGRRQMCPNNEWRLSAIRDGISGSIWYSCIVKEIRLARDIRWDGHSKTSGAAQGLQAWKEINRRRQKTIILLQRHYMSLQTRLETHLLKCLKTFCLSLKLLSHKPQAKCWTSACISWWHFSSCAV